MRILHINTNYIGTTLHQLMIDNLDAQGIENEVFVPTYDKSVSVIEVKNNVYVSECFNKVDRYFFDYKQSKIIRAIEEHYDVKSFDLIHAYTLFTDGNAARVLSEKYDVPYVVAVRNTDVNDFFAKRIFLRRRGIKNFLSARKVFFLSDAYKKYVLKKYVPFERTERNKNRIEIIPNGIDSFWLENEYRGKREIDRSCVNLVYAGVIDRNKNIRETQKAMAILHEQGIQTHLTVVGKIKEQAEYEKVVSDKNTTYIPAQQKEKLIEIYRKSDIFVMPSIHESFGLVYPEAMSQGLPVIYTKGQGFDTQFEEGYVGYHHTVGNPKELADLIVLIMENYQSMSKNAENGAKRYDWNAISERYANLYIEIIRIDSK